MFRKIIFSFLLLALVFCLGVFYLYNKKLNEPLVSPLKNQDQVSGVNQWIPKVLAASITAGPEITAKSAFFIDASSGEVLYSKDPHEKLPIASLTKVMTALVAIEHKTMEANFLVPERATQMEPDTMSLIAGESLSLKELLYGVFLLSANDAAETIAQDTTGSRDEFINLMNAKAKEIGMNETHYTNPTGLDEDSGDTVSSTYDLSILTRYFIKNHPEIMDISSNPYVELPATQTHQDYQIYSGINLITTYPGVIGFKIGYTPDAGFTIITLARKNGHEIIGVLLNSESRRDETKELLDYSFTKLQNSQ